MACVLVAACSAPTGSTDINRTRDIFQEDAENKNRRRAASENETLWTVYMEGCTGSLISRNLLLTAWHCLPRDSFDRPEDPAGQSYVSGYSLTEAGELPETLENGDITVEGIAEQDEALDYAILDISWNDDYPEGQKLLPQIATSPGEITTSEAEDAGESVYTVGFPADKEDTWGATYARGRLKGGLTIKSDDTGERVPPEEGSHVLFNIGIINGSSGGPVLSRANDKLISLANGGPTVYSEENTDWKGADKTDPTRWNWGPAAWNVYDSSEILKSVFPDGTNKALEAEPTDVHLAIKQLPEDDGRFAVFVFAGAATADLRICETAELSACNEGAEESLGAQEVTELNGGRVFAAARAVTITAETTLSVVAQDDSGSVIKSPTYSFQK